ncbi:MAG: glycosyl hydrolase 53 family protein [Bacteroidales bacterium]|nr:glycosyl hydrolase 53 family protein [Bacteroidales bacterium]
MKRLLIALALLLPLLACEDPIKKGRSGGTDTPETPVTPEPQPVDAPAYALGADISWVTEMEKKGYKFYTSAGVETECTALMKSLGCNAVRYRVWVNPADGWCNKADVLVKAKRAAALGLSIMIDFHYSDTWADPSNQEPPAAWAAMSLAQMTTALSNHTKDVLQALKSSGVSVAWVQVGNETNTGMCLPTGAVASTDASGFITLANAGYDAVKSVYPDAYVILHHSSAENLSANKWFYNLVKTAKYDMIGLSLYPSYWENGGYPDWTTKTHQAVANFTSIHNTFSKPVMLVEFGMPASEPANAKAALQYVVDNTKNLDWFKGVFYWEPESEQSRNNYGYGAFASGKPTIALDPFKI